MHGSGVRRPEQARRGVFAARRLLDLGRAEWSRASLTEHLRQSGKGQSAAWHRGFLAVLIIEDIVSACDANAVLAALNPGHWTSTGVSDAFLEFAQQFAAMPRQATFDGMDLFSQKSLGELPLAHEPAPLLDGDTLTQRDIIEDWLDVVFFQLDDDRAAMQADYRSSISDPALPAIEGDWSEALLRSSELLTEMGWRVRFADALNPHADDEIDEATRIITLAASRPASALTLLRALSRSMLERVERGTPSERLRLDLATEMTACVLGLALNVNFVHASVASGRTMLLSSDCEPSDIYPNALASALNVAEALLDLLGIDLAQTET